MDEFLAVLGIALMVIGILTLNFWLVIIGIAFICAIPLI